MRWNGFVEVTAAGGGAGCVCDMGGGGGAAAGGPDSEDTELLLKYGFLDCSTTGVEFVIGGLLSGVASRTLLLVDDAAGGGAEVGAGGGIEAGVGKTWLVEGVVSCGVLSCRPSSSEDDSSPRLSS